MPSVLWLVVGIVLTLIGMLPIIRVLLRRAEQRARAAERRARRAERLAELGSMTGGLAHEIKNPLSTIGLNAQLLREDLNDVEMPHEQLSRLTRRLDALSREVDRLKDILTDFLQFAGRLKLDAQPHDIGELVSELADFFHPQCEQAGVMLRTQSPGEKIIAQVDEGLLKQALLNLMINAVHAIEGAAATGVSPDGPDGPTGELMLRVEPDLDEIRIHVTDTGPGIGPDKLEHIFHPYVSGHAGGTGLGLPTARRIVEEHGGRVEAHSEVGRGSDFVIRLPREVQPAQSEQSRHPAQT